MRLFSIRSRASSYLEMCAGMVNLWGRARKWIFLDANESILKLLVS